MFGTPMSLQFRLFGIPVQVDLFFLILAVIIGRNSAGNSIPLLGLLVVIVFVSVLLHELGHALFARMFGQQPFIALYGLGGVTSWRQAGELSAGRRLLIALAGPAVGLVIGVLALLPALMFREDRTASTIALWVVWTNLGWGILNLVPMLPLDGGKIMASVFDLIAPGRGARAARYGSIVTAVLLIPLSIKIGLYMMVLYCAFAIWSNAQDLRQPKVPPASEAVIDVTADVPPPPDDPSRPPRLP